MSGVADAFGDISEGLTKGVNLATGDTQKRQAQAQLDKQKALDQARYNSNLDLATKQAALQKSSAQGQYDLATANENTKFQADDQAQLDALNKAVSDPSMSLDSKLAIIDSQIKAGLGTESTKLALQAKQIAQQDYDLNAVGGQRDLQQKQLDQQLQGAQSNILGLTQARDAGIAQGANADAALGISGEGVDRQTQAQQFTANTQIQAAAQQAGYVLDQTPTDMTSGTVFDQALRASLAGPNTNQDLFSNNVAQARLGLDTAQQGFGNDITGLSAADSAYRKSSAFGLQTNMDNADLGLAAATAGNDFSFQQSQINTQGQQYQIDNIDPTMNFLAGISQVALWATNPVVGAGLTGFGNWVASSFGGQPAQNYGTPQTQSPDSSYGDSMYTLDLSL